MITDPGVLAYIRTTHIRSHSLIQKMIRELYGLDFTIEEVRHASAAFRRSGKKSMAAANPSIMDFICDHMDRMTFQELADAGAREYGAFPSKSQVHRIVKRLRETDRKKVEGEGHPQRDGPASAAFYGLLWAASSPDVAPCVLGEPEWVHRCTLFLCTPKGEIPPVESKPQGATTVEPN